MILTCPACGTQYVVKDGAIPPGGRQVRCASCRHSWHQNPDDKEEAIPGEESVEAPAGDETGAVDPATDVSAEQPADSAADLDAAGHSLAESGDVDADARGRQVEDIGYEEHPASPAGDAEDEFTPFAVGGSDEPRRRSAAYGVLVAVVVIVAAALAFWYLAPAEWRARVGLAEAAETPLQLMMTHSDRQRLASGNELLAISGRVINPTQEQQSVPPITAQLRDARGKLVYSWTIAPPAPNLKAGDSASFYSAEVNVPAGGDELTVTLGAPKA